MAKVSEKLREAVAQPYCLNGHKLYVEVSVGISVYSADGDHVESLRKNAEIAMYVAKETREGYRCFTEALNHNALERMRLESCVRTALQEN
ncbi:hypothetical protein CSA56_14625 [candidate division KSB3 bacterium]|uniref:GGDEF domain-containing protein n=1 Tax=candidate division KSB3 bacterium TaxID=2044937 RepID=A0A2G6KAD4_9BACT|nr:MAG: hypothetical protein CSA56_14625 [candidate division KSB3 bacterium]